MFEDFTPPEAPAAGVLLFRPGPATWLPATDRVARGVTVDDWVRDSVVAAAVPWSALSMRRAALWTRLPEGVQAAVRVGEDALVVQGRSGVPWTAVGFLPRDSDFPLQPAFPLFLGDSAGAADRAGTRAARRARLPPPAPRTPSRAGRPTRGTRAARASRPCAT